MLLEEKKQRDLDVHDRIEQLKHLRARPIMSPIQLRPNTDTDKVMLTTANEEMRCHFFRHVTEIREVDWSLLNMIGQSLSCVKSFHHDVHLYIRILV